MAGRLQHLGEAAILALLDGGESGDSDSDMEDLAGEDDGWEGHAVHPGEDEDEDMVEEELPEPLLVGEEVAEPPDQVGFYNYVQVFHCLRRLMK